MIMYYSPHSSHSIPLSSNQHTHSPHNRMVTPIVRNILHRLLRFAVRKVHVIIAVRVVAVPKLPMTLTAAAAVRCAIRRSMRIAVHRITVLVLGRMRIRLPRRWHIPIGLSGVHTGQSDADHHQQQHRLQPETPDAEHVVGHAWARSCVSVVICLTPHPKKRTINE